MVADIVAALFKVLLLESTQKVERHMLSRSVKAGLVVLLATNMLRH